MGRSNVPVVTAKHTTPTKGMYFPLMFDTHPRTRAYVPVNLVSTMGLSDGWTDGTEHSVTITLRHSLRGQTQLDFLFDFLLHLNDSNTLLGISSIGIVCFSKSLAVVPSIMGNRA